MDPRAAGRVPRPARAYAGRPGPTAAQFRFRRGVLAVGVLMVVALVWGLVGRPDPAPVPLHLAWAFSPASNTVTIRLTHPAGTPGQTLADSRLAVSENGYGHLERRSAGGGTVQLPVPPGTRTSLLVRLTGPQPLTETLTVTAPPALRYLASRGGSGRWLVSMSSPLRAPPQVLCAEDQVSLPASSQVAVSEGWTACQAQLRLTAQDGEQAVVPVTIPATAHPRLPAAAPLYCFANPAGRAVYITIDDGWTPSALVLAIMRRTHVPITAFLIKEAAAEHLSYWRAFVAAGGMIGDHTVSHPDLTRLSLSRATAQWAQARTALGRWFGQTPALGRPPYGSFNHKVEVAAARAGLPALAGWSATMVGNRIDTWDGGPLVPGEIVILHWVPGLGHQLAALLVAIRALHLRPAPLTPASFAGITPQTRTLSGD